MDRRRCRRRQAIAPLGCEGKRTEPTLYRKVSGLMSLPRTQELARDHAWQRSPRTS